MKQVLLVILSSIFIASCTTGNAERPQMTHDEWVNMTSRHYEGVSGNDVFDAVQKMMNLSDKENIRYEFRPNSIMAERNVIIPLSGFAYIWTVTVDEGNNSNSSDVSVLLEMITDTSLFTPMRLDVSWPDNYHLFFSRLDYLLGKNDRWYSCDGYKQEFPDHYVLEPMCLMADDLSPNTPAAN